MADLVDGKDAASPFFSLERSTLTFMWAWTSRPQKFMLEQLVSSMTLTISLRWGKMSWNLLRYSEHIPHLLKLAIFLYANNSEFVHLTLRSSEPLSFSMFVIKGFNRMQILTNPFPRITVNRYQKRTFGGGNVKFSGRERSNFNWDSERENNNPNSPLPPVQSLSTTQNSSRDP